ncbi:MAG: carboxymuconolactone decarboxylase family protein [Myxococcales bacterium]|nr:carboxymuconolactone decarboxylase family protein [Myxococcales bacterium]
MLIRTMSRMMETIAGTTIYHVEPPHPQMATGLAGRVYDQMRRDFMVAAPFVLHGEFPPMLAGVWALLRETLMVGKAPRGGKETVAWTVSMSNECPFCVDAHYAAMQAAHAHAPRLQDWARAMATSRTAQQTQGPFEQAHAPEFFGTVVAFHYLNRVVSVFLSEAMMPTPQIMSPITDRMAVTMMEAMIVKRNTPGEAVALVPPHIDELAFRPDWAHSNRHVEGALAAWSATIESVAMLHIDPKVRRIVGTVIEHWDGTRPPNDETWLNSFCARAPERHSPAIKLALLAAIEPYKVTDERVERFLRTGANRTQVLTLVAWAAMRAACRVGSWLR